MVTEQLILADLSTAGFNLSIFDERVSRERGGATGDGFNPGATQPPSGHAFPTVRGATVAGPMPSHPHGLSVTARSHGAAVILSKEGDKANANRRIANAGNRR